MTDTLDNAAGGEGAGRATHVAQFVTFALGDQRFAVEMAPVEEIIRLPRTVRVPLAPAALEGLANLRGRVLPVMNLRTMLGLPPHAADDATRVLVVKHGATVGFVVDRVARVASVDANRIEPAGDLAVAGRNDLVTGVIKEDDGTLVAIVDFEKLVLEQDEAADPAAGPVRGRLAGSREGDAETRSAARVEEAQLVSFRVAGIEYALPIDAVQEIVQVPPSLTRVPQAGGHVLGLISLRDRLLPLVSLRAFFGLPQDDTDEQSRIVVMTRTEDGVRTAIGVVVDGVNEVLRVARSALEAPPALIEASGAGDVAAICRLSETRIVSILAPDRLFASGSQGQGAEAASREGEDDVTTQTQVAARDHEEQVVVFRLAEEEYGVPIASVQEIVRVPDALTRIPRSPAFVEGVVNLRGAVLPVIDQRTRFGLDRVERNDRQRIMVFLVNGQRTGFIVDSVAEVAKIPASAIQQAPQLSSAAARVVRRIANLEAANRMILLVDPAELLGAEETAALDDFAAVPA